MPKYNVKEGTLVDRFLRSTVKIQIMGGGFGNGKTAASVIKVLSLAQAYPGSNILVARETRPKLNDTIRKEFLKWCPKHWIKSFPMSDNSSNTCTLNNGSMVNFRYIRQEGKSTEASTSNLLSATYDAVVVDQLEDPGITYKDFIDLFGRLRGNTPFAGNYEFAEYVNMPQSGPRWMIVTLNPTRNWVYKKLVKPLHVYNASNTITADLLILKDKHQRPILDEQGKPKLLVELFEGSTYENIDNLAEDFISTMESIYTGQMRERFLLGKWGAFEGLVYPMFDDTQTRVNPMDVVEYHSMLKEWGVDIKYVEAYDHGLAAPSCYLFAFVDVFNNVIIADGFYEAEYLPAYSIKQIKRIRERWVGTSDNERFKDILADPDIFRRKTADTRSVGKSTADIFHDDGFGIRTRRANNDIMNGIIKVGTYLNPMPNNINPFTTQRNAPHLYVSSHLEFWFNEIEEYSWKKDTQQNNTDKPVDKRDHAMDTTKYLLTDMPKASELLPVDQFDDVPQYLKWHEHEAENSRRNAHRYGR